MADTDPSNGGGRGPRLPPGFRFHPTDEELVVQYLKKKAQSAPLPVSIIAEIDLYKFDPWELPAKAVFGEQEWYFFSPRDRKYPNGARPNRAATSGYWKATGTDKPVLTSGGTQKVGVKKALVFYGGKPPKGTKTDWIMHEYRLITGNKAPAYDPTPNKRASLRLDDWVLCRIYKKNTKDHREREEELTGVAPSELGLRRHVGRSSVAASTYTPNSSQIISTDYRHEHHLFDEMPAPETKRPAMMASSLMFPDDVGEASGSNAMAGLLHQLQPNQSQVPLGESVFRHPYQISGFTWYS